MNPMMDLGLAWPGFAPPVRLPAAQLAAVHDAYAQPPRAYHHFGHVVDVMHRYAEVAAGPAWRQPCEVWWAVLYHDAIHVPGRKDNELRSAMLAREHHARWVASSGNDGMSIPAVDIDRVADLIAWTARHGRVQPEVIVDVEGRSDLLHFLDCDMAILAAPESVFDAYDRGIAEEYRAVPRWLFRRKRRQFFRDLLALDRIFLSEFFHARLDAQARHNLVRALG